MGGPGNCRKESELRKRQYEITDRDEIIEILDSTNIGRIATIDSDGYPYITPLNFVFMDENIYFHCARQGERLDNISADPRVCFEVDMPLSYLDMDFDDSAPACGVTQYYRSVIIRGNASVVTDQRLKLDALNALMAKHEKVQDFNQIDPESAGFKACHVVEIRPVSVTAKENLAQTKPEEHKQRIAKYLRNRDTSVDDQTADLIETERP